MVTRQRNNHNLLSLANLRAKYGRDAVSTEIGCNLLLIGNPMVGKTSLLRQLIKPFRVEEGSTYTVGDVAESGGNVSLRLAEHSVYVNTNSKDIIHPHIIDSIGIDVHLIRKNSEVYPIIIRMIQGKVIDEADIAFLLSVENFTDEAQLLHHDLALYKGRKFSKATVIAFVLNAAATPDEALLLLSNLRSAGFPIIVIITHCDSPEGKKQLPVVRSRLAGEYIFQMDAREDYCKESDVRQIWETALQKTFTHQ